MILVSILLASFICFWSFRFLLQTQTLIPESRYTFYLNLIYPFFLVAAFLYIHWIALAMVAWAVFILGQWFRRDAVSVKIICALTVLAMGFEFFLQRLSLLTQAQEPEMWIFWLGDTSWRGVFLGVLIGFIFALIHREKGHSWWIAPALMVAGIGSLGLAWGIFLGDRLERTTWKSSVFSLVGIVSGILFMNIYAPAFKVEIWLLACLVWICVEAVIFRRQFKI